MVSEEQDVVLGWEVSEERSPGDTSRPSDVVDRRRVVPVARKQLERSVPDVAHGPEPVAISETRRIFARHRDSVARHSLLTPGAKWVRLLLAVTLSASKELDARAI